jgi:hypothetical protein
MPEVRVMAEGTLRVVQGSGSGRTWATGASQPSALLAYVQSFSWTSGQTVTTIKERGVPDHHKITEKDPIDVTFECLWTGSFPSAITASGASIPHWHIEHKALAPEIGATSAFYHQFHGAALQNIQFTEQSEGNRISLTFRTLGMNGPTASGYLG